MTTSFSPSGDPGPGCPDRIRPSSAELSNSLARRYLESLRWPSGPVCPRCGDQNASRVGGIAARPGLYRCRGRPECGQFTVTVGTIMERSHLSLRYWIGAFRLMAEQGDNPSPPQLRERLGLRSRTSARYLSQRIREASLRDPLASAIVNLTQLKNSGGPVDLDSATEDLLRAALREHAQASPPPPGQPI